MPSNNIKRSIALLLALLLVLSVMPVQALAEETTKTSTETEQEISALTETTSETTISEERDPLAQVRKEIDDYITHYGLSADMSDGQLAEAYFAIDEAEPLVLTWADEIITMLQEVSAEEQDALFTEENVNLFLRFCDVVDRINTPEVVANTVKPVDGLEITDSVGNGSFSEMKYTATATGGNWTGTTNTITITNTSSVTKKLTFDYAVAGKYSSYSFASASGSLEIVLQSKETSTYTFESQAFKRTATLTLSNINYTDVATTVDVTVDFDNTLGTVTVGGATATPDTAVPNISTSAATTLAATPNSSVTFVGWINPSTGALISTSATCSTTFAENTTIAAVFSTKSSPAWFKASGVYWTDDLQAAVDYAYSNSDKTVIAMCSGTLPAGKSYEIKSGVKLLIPHSASDSGAFGSEPSIQMDTTPIDSPAYAFRTLTVPSSTTITCSGEINVNGHRTGNGQPFCGTAVSGYGKIILGSESTSFSNPSENSLKTQLTIANGGKLYCYGYITGSGMVEVENGGTVHELLQMGDWPGGSNGTGWKEGTSKQFLLSQYYVQNIEAPFKIKYGGTVNFEGVITASSIELKVSSTFIGTSSGLFQIKSSDGYVLRIYDQSRDRMNYHAENGTFTFGNVTLYKNMYYIIQIDINSANSILPLTNNLSVYIGSGATFNMGNRSAILPGAEVIIEEGATVNLSNNLYIYDFADWKATKLNSSGTYSNIMFFNRTADAINAKSAPVGVNTTPQCNPLPYVATANGVSPAATTYFYYESTSYNQTNPKPITASGKLVVNGTLNVQSGGALYTTTGGTSANKAITGTGVIDYTAGTVGTAGSITVGTGSYETAVDIGPAVAYLAGFDGLQNFGKYVYHGQANGYWYNYKVTAVDTVGNPVGNAITVQGNAAGSHPDIPALVGYVSYNTTGQSSFQFTTTTPSVDKTMNGEASTLTPVDGVYKLENVTADVNLTLPLTPGVIYATNIRAGDSLDLYFYVQESALENKDTFEARITRTKLDDEGNLQTITVDPIPYSSWEKYDASLLRFCYEGIAAKEMTDTVSAAIIDTSTGYQHGTTVNESIQNYAMRAFNYSNNGDLRTMLVDMLNYGAAAQTHFKYTAVPLANAKLTADHTPYASGQVDKQNLQDTCKWVTNKNGYNYSAYVTLKSDLFFNFYFTGVPEGATAVTSYKDHYNRTQTQRFTAEGTTLDAQMTGLAAADGSQIITCTLYNSAGTEIGSAQGSVEGYIRNSLYDDTTEPTLVTVCQELMKYINSANKYFTNN